jgi:predicted MFS family arabinose efflux permease
LGGPSIRAAATGVVLSTFGILPVFLVGALAVFIDDDIGFDEAQLGVSVAVFFTAAAVASLPAGRFAERIGATWALTLGMVGGATFFVGAALAGRWWHLAAWLVVAGSANAVTQLSANLLLAGKVAPGRQGVAFGIKQSAIPSATLTAGAAVPLLGVTVGWRPVFVLMAGGALACAVWQGRVRGGQPVRRLQRAVLSSPKAPLVVFAMCNGFGAAAATGLGAFLVPYGVSVGMTPGAAGGLLVAGSLAAVCCRLVLGVLADQWDRDNLRVTTSMLGLGAVALVVMPIVGHSSVLLVGAVVIAFGAGWGWPGLFNYLIVRANMDAPAVATGITQIGVYLGGVAGPLLFGLVVARWSFAVAWTAAGAALGCAAALMLLGRSMLARETG